MSGLSRRAFLGTAAAAAPAGAALAAMPTNFGPVAPDDGAAWARIAALYDAPPAGIVQLENGHFGAMARSTRAAFAAHTARINAETTLYTRGPVSADMQAVRAKAAALLGVDPQEIAFTRGGTESMQTLILGYNRLRPGDAVLYADLDYDSMQAAMESLAARRGVRVTRIALPEPAGRQALIDAYDQALQADPKIRLILLTHLSHRTGLIPPVAEIVALARRRGVDVLLDCGHALGQTDFSLRAMGVEFAGLNLHKWIGAPLGVGIVYIKRDRIRDIDVSPLEAPGSDRIDARIHTGTVNFATLLSVADAIDVHQAIGVANKAARLRYLRDRWAKPLRDARGITILTPDDPALHAGITSFRIDGVTTMAANAALRKRLFDRWKIFTIERDGPARGACIRVTPTMITTTDHVDRLASALATLIGEQKA